MVEVELVVTYTKDIRKKKGKKWLDGKIIVDSTSRRATLKDEDTQKTLASIERLPSDVSLDTGGGEAFEMSLEEGKAGYLVQVDDVHVEVEPKKSEMFYKSIIQGSDRLINAKTLLPSSAPNSSTTNHAPNMKQIHPESIRRPLYVENNPLEAPKRRTTEELLNVLGIAWEKPADAPASTKANPVVLASSWNAHKPVKRILQNINKTEMSMKRPMIERGESLPQSACPNFEQALHPQRKVCIPTKFHSIPQYVEVMKNAIQEEMYLRVIESVLGHFVSCIANVQKQAGSAVAPHQLDEACQKAKIREYHGECHLKFFSKDKRKQMDDEDPESTLQNKDSVYLVLGSLRRAKAADYHKSDVWIISNSPSFGFSPKEGTKYSGTAWMCAVKSLWHGPNKDGKFQVEFVSNRPQYLAKSTKVYALQGPELAMELDLISLFSTHLNLDSLQTPVLTSSLLNESSAFTPNNMIDDDPEVRSVSERFSLNEYQKKALSHVASWNYSGSDDQNSSPLCLVHGPFGSGKSSTLVAILHLILKLRASSGALSNARVMVCSHTNIAVDRVLLGLLQSGIADFIRVGALRKIHHNLLSHSLHASESKSKSNALSELKEMAKSATGTILAKLKAEMSEIERGADRKRKKMLKTCPIVGVTCVSTALEVLQDQYFDILLLDEASQLTEPLCLAPIMRSNCKYVIIAGDPNQLPPVVCSPENVEGVSTHGLSRPLFVRLTDLGHVPHLLKTQYRCHPDISCISNQFFYNNQLIDGVDAQQRRSMIPSMPSVSVVDLQNGQENYQGKSLYNPSEVRAVGNIVKTLLSLGISPSDIGIISFYKAHVDALRKCIYDSNDPGDPSQDIQIATVDSFQGAEKELIILSTATTKPSSFAADACRLNVAITRARKNLVLVGNIHMLSKGIPAFNFILSRAKTKGGYFLGGLPHISHMKQDA